MMQASFLVAAPSYGAGLSLLGLEKKKTVLLNSVITLSAYYSKIDYRQFFGLRFFT